MNMDPLGYSLSNRRLDTGLYYIMYYILINFYDLLYRLSSLSSKSDEQTLFFNVQVGVIESHTIMPTGRL